MDIDFKLIRLHAGWADVELSGDEGSSVNVDGSYLSDCLRDLVDAIQSLHTTKASSCSWAQEPGVVLWKFVRSGENVDLTLELDGKTIFTGNTKLRRLALKILNEFERVLSERGSEQYESAWGYSFPFEACEKLRSMIGNEKAGPRTNS